MLDLIVCVFVFTFDCLFGRWLYCGFVVCGFGFGCWIGCIANFWLPWGWMAGLVGDLSVYGCWWCLVCYSLYLFLCLLVSGFVLLVHRFGLGV